MVQQGIKMKKLVIMGGGLNQTPLIKAANEHYYTVVCDANPNAIGRTMASEFRCVNIADPQKVEEVCREIGAAGVICNTESLMVRSAKVQTDMGYVGNTPEAVNNLSNKYMFRKTQEKAGVYYPKVNLFTSLEDARNFLAAIERPMIIKPAESSGSRGVKILRGPEDLTRELYDMNVSCSRNDTLIIEEYVDYVGRPTLEAEVFLIDGRIEHLCIYRTLRDKKLNLVPQCYCSDLKITEEELANARETLDKVFKAAGIMWGQYNAELTITNSDEIFIFEINARQGGMMLPNFVRIFTGIDLNKMLVTTAAGDDFYVKEVRENPKEWSKTAIHFRMMTEEDGLYDGYTVKGDAARYQVDEFLYFEKGEPLVKTEDGYASVGTVDFVFDTIEQSDRYEESLFNDIAINVRQPELEK